MRVPLMLEVAGLPTLIVGGGAVARRRGLALAEAGAELLVVAPRVDVALAAVAEVRLRPYAPGDAAGARLVITASDDPAANAAAAAEGAAAGALVCRADAPEAGEVAFPASQRRGPLTVAVATDGASASAAAAIRRQLSAALDPRWPALLRALPPYRARARQIADPVRRRQALRALASPEALALADDPAALARRSEDLLAGAAS